jgi:hypothetical protein
MQKNKYIMEIFYFDKVTKKETIIYETFELDVDLFFSDSILMKMKFLTFLKSIIQNLKT